MIKRTLVQLTIWNSAIVFVLFVMLGGALYGLARYQIYTDIDRQLAFDIDHMQQVTLGNGKQIVTIFSDEPERYVLDFWWDTDDTLIQSAYYETQYMQLSVLLREKRDHRGPETIRMGGKIYRFVSRPYQAGQLPEVDKLSDKPLKTVQMITEMTAEVRYLEQLLWSIGIGIGIGALLSVLAGYALARRALIPIQRAWDKQQQFVADASHELRSPLSVVQGQVQTLLRHPEHTIEEESMPIAAILKETKRMRNMVSGLLLLARGDTREAVIANKPVRMDGILRELASNLEPIAAYKQLRLQLHVEGADMVVQGDEERLTQLFMILLDNAMKFTPASGQIDVRCVRQGKAVVVTVTDDGAGIPAQDLPRVFDRFYKGDAARDREDPGAGLGLSIARWIVDQHHGTIEIHSQAGNGTTVTVRFPGGVSDRNVPDSSRQPPF